MRSRLLHCIAWHVSQKEKCVEMSAKGKCMICSDMIPLDTERVCSSLFFFSVSIRIQDMTWISRPLLPLRTMNVETMFFSATEPRRSQDKTNHWCVSRSSSGRQTHRLTVGQDADCLLFFKNALDFRPGLVRLLYPISLSAVYRSPQVYYGSLSTTSCHIYYLSPARFRRRRNQDLPALRSFIDNVIDAPPEPGELHQKQIPPRRTECAG